ncbi:family 14 glycosylhydrolase [Domibacillus indicus]|uniref:family 14 glycosylhydrolase n=1 Tax=Domibacillus indicus TaxID=1437523 RepID=UPI002040D3AA|nr:family 14 glycosylhydrolase [Domibacillus indicus]MCM3789158.1 family 14 glycosylhydrolase [Domibacillus indicus]
MRKVWYGWLLFSLLFVAAVGGVQPAQADVQKEYKLYVMAPLTEITDWEAFEEKLKTMKENGVYALTTDIWWGMVEGKGDNQFDWSYYEKYAQAVQASGLKWVPIMSTHQCGGNVGDDCNYPIPSWLWKKDSVENMAFKSESGYLNKEALAPWWEGTAKQYEEFYRAFARQFADEEELIVKIYLSGGPAGELRYPSYQFADGWEWPERGQLQAYTEGAEKDYQDYLKTKYKNVKKLNAAWGTAYKSWAEIDPPANGDAFFESGDAYKPGYGQEFMSWYQGALEKHMENISKAAHKQFDRTFDVPIGIKISGIHWKMNDPEMPHAAEYSTGYYQYGRLLDHVKKADLALTFTCLEMDDNNAQVPPYYSAPKTLVAQIATLANERGISLNGENALALINNEWGFNNAAEMVFNYGFDGFTLLRMNYLFKEAGNPTNEFHMMKDKLALVQMPVTFTVSNVPEEAKHVYVVGDRGEMGRWNPGQYKYELTKNMDGSWSGSVNLAADRLYSFKFWYENAAGERIWQSGQNNHYTTPSAGEAFFNGEW